MDGSEMVFVVLRWQLHHVSLLPLPYAFLGVDLRDIGGDSAFAAAAAADITVAIANAHLLKHSLRS